MHDTITALRPPISIAYWGLSSHTPSLSFLNQLDLVWGKMKSTVWKALTKLKQVRSHGRTRRVWIFLFKWTGILIFYQTHDLRLQTYYSTVVPPSPRVPSVLDHSWFFHLFSSLLVHSVSAFSCDLSLSVLLHWKKGAMRQNLSTTKHTLYTHTQISFPVIETHVRNLINATPLPWSKGPLCGYRFTVIVLYFLSKTLISCRSTSLNLRSQF